MIDALGADRRTVGDGNRAYVGERLGLERHVDRVIEVFTDALRP